MRDYLYRELYDMNKPGVRFLWFMAGMLAGIMLFLFMAINSEG